MSAYRDRVCHKHFSPDQIVRKVYKGNIIPHVRRGSRPKLLSSSESIEEDIAKLTSMSQKRRKQSIESRSARKNQKLIIPKEEMIDRGYYYVKRSRKQKIAVTPEVSSPSNEDSEPENQLDEDEECPTLEIPPIIETVEGFCKIEHFDTSSESEVESKLNDQSNKDAITSINDLLSSALLDVDQPGSSDPAVDEISFNKNFISNECSKITCRQLSSRLSLLQRERERLNRLRDLLVTEVDLLQQRVEKMTDGDDAVDTACLSCADGRLEAFFQSNLARVKMLREKAAQYDRNSRTV
uniref:THAP-type domain-containing protein n=1 Tax=Romanomermis culicivorax TaxID=13658 RepID=A0A915J9J8_ROMCU